MSSASTVHAIEKGEHSHRPWTSRASPGSNLTSGVSSTENGGLPTCVYAMSPTPVSNCTRFQTRSCLKFAAACAPTKSTRRPFQGFQVFLRTRQVLCWHQPVKMHHWKGQKARQCDLDYWQPIGCTWNTWVWIFRCCFFVCVCVCVCVCVLFF